MSAPGISQRKHPTQRNAFCSAEISDASPEASRERKSIYAPAPTKEIKMLAKTMTGEYPAEPSSPDPSPASMCTIIARWLVLVCVQTHTAGAGPARRCSHDLLRFHEVKGAGVLNALGVGEALSTTMEPCAHPTTRLLRQFLPSLFRIQVGQAGVLWENDFWIFWIIFWTSINNFASDNSARSAGPAVDIAW